MLEEIIGKLSVRFFEIEVLRSTSDLDLIEDL